MQRELEQELETQRTRYAELAEARRKESDARHVRRVALEAFNRSEHVERVIAISRSLGDPIVNVAVDGLDLPRPVKITVAWDISWYEYIVRLDLLERTVTVEEARRGDDPASSRSSRCRQTACCAPTGSCSDAGLRRRRKRRVGALTAAPTSSADGPAPAAESSRRAARSAPGSRPGATPRRPCAGTRPPSGRCR